MLWWQMCIGLRNIPYSFSVDYCISHHCSFSPLLMMVMMMVLIFCPQSKGQRRLLKRHLHSSTLRLHASSTKLELHHEIEIESSRSDHWSLHYSTAGSGLIRGQVRVTLLQRLGVQMISSPFRVSSPFFFGALFCCLSLDESFPVDLSYRTHTFSFPVASASDRGPSLEFLYSSLGHLCSSAWFRLVLELKISQRYSGLTTVEPC
jgi:hypothetical protein